MFEYHRLCKYSTIVLISKNRPAMFLYLNKIISGDLKYVR